MMSFWVVPWRAVGVDAVLLGRDDVEREQPRRRRVDRHRRVHLVQRDAVEQRVHVALVGDRHADLADLAAGELVVGVVAGLRRQVEGDRQPRLALGEVPAVELVGLPRSNGPRRCASSTGGRARAGGDRSCRGLYGQSTWRVLRADRRPAPRQPARDLLLRAGRRPRRPGPESASRRCWRRWATGRRGASCSPTSTSTTRARRGARAALARRSRSTCTSAARRTWPTRAAVASARRALRRRHGPPVGRDRARPGGAPAGAPRRRDGSSGFRVAYTPGHAVAPRLPTSTSRRGTAFVGDVAGVRSTDGPVLPPTPPPDIDLEAWHASIDIIERLGARRASRSRTSARSTTSPSSSRRCARASTAGATWPAVDEEGFVAALVEEIAGAPTPEPRAAFLQAMPPETLATGRASTATGASAPKRRRCVARRGYLERREPDHRASARRRARQRPRRRLAGDRPQRRPQHLRPRRPHAGALHPRRHRRPAATRWPTASTTPGQAIVWSGHREPAELYWEQLQRRRPDHGPARAGLTRRAWRASSSAPCCATSARTTRPSGSRPTPPATSRCARLRRRRRTFEVEGHHFALIHVTGLEPDEARALRGRLDGERVWPPARIRPGRRASSARSPTITGCASLRLLPRRATRRAAVDADQGRGPARAASTTRSRARARMRAQDAEDWPHLLLLLGDQVYADEVPPRRAGSSQPAATRRCRPASEVADFEEYCRLYRDSWSRARPCAGCCRRCPTAMIFDDHDVHDDWNTSRTGSRDIRAQGWWDERIVGGFMSYWASSTSATCRPRTARTTRCTARSATATATPAPIVREFAFARRPRDRGRALELLPRRRPHALVMMDSRAGRVLQPGARTMVDAEEWDCIERLDAQGSFNHLLLGTSLPAFLGRGMHFLEAFDEAVCRGRVGPSAARLGEPLRQGARPRALGRVRRLAPRPRGPPRAGRARARRRRPRPGASCCSRATCTTPTSREPSSPTGSGDRAPVYQAVCSPLRNPLDSNERRAIRFAHVARRPSASAGRSRGRGRAGGPLRWDDRGRARGSTTRWRRSSSTGGAADDARQGRGAARRRPPRLERVVRAALA